MGYTTKNMVKAITANAYKNTGGTVVFGGAANTTGVGPNGPAVTNVPSKTILYNSNNKTGIGSVVPVPETSTTINAGTDTAGVFKANDSGTWAKLGQFLIRGTAVTALAGVANTLLSKVARSATAPARSIHREESRRTIRITSWSMTTGKPVIGSVVDDSFGDDHAARPTLAVPGEFVYLLKTNTPTMADYPARTQN